MSIDMSQFYQVFFEESAEHLAEMESLLLELDIQNPDSEQLNAIFRAAHSIKGSAGTFGFTDLTEVTHILENLLDRVRKQELDLRADMVDAFLVSGDLLKDMLAAHQGQESVDPARIESMCERLRQLSSDQNSAEVSVATPVAAPRPVVENSAQPDLVDDAADLPPAPAAEDPGGVRAYDIEFVPTEQAAVGDGLQNFLEDLGQIGRCEVTARPENEKVPGFWRLRLLTDVPVDQFSEQLDFIADNEAWRVSEDRSVSADGSVAFGLFGGDAPGTPDEERGYGFFENHDPVPGVSTTLALPSSAAVDVDGSYGFFEPLPEAGSNRAVAVTETAYGFFEPLPSAGALSEASPPVLAPVEDAADGSYGFFAPVETESQKTVVVSEKPSAQLTDGDGYGFFEPLDAASVPAKASGEATAPVSYEPVTVVPTSAPTEAPTPVPTAAVKAGPGGDAAKATAAKPAAAAGDSSIRVSVEKVDQLINLVGELVITQAMLQQTASQLEGDAPESLTGGLTQLERNTRDLQESVMSIRMLPMSFVFSRFPRVVRDLSSKLGKQVELKTFGETTELDKGLIERITDPLTHLIRNSLDHGIEMPEARRQAGKSPVGTITLKASHQGGNVVIEVGDDGAGLNRQRILTKARERGMQVSDQMSDQEVFGLIFEAGFSTADQVTDVSGRGVGMDVVRKNIQALGGRVEIESMPGIGTRMTVRLPLTLAILDGMSVGVGSQTYILPLSYVVESIQPQDADIRSLANSGRVIQVRGEYLPVIVLHELFNIPTKATHFPDGIMVVLEADGAKAALFVDALLGQHQVVIKSLEANYRRVQYISGATIMGDGHVALILDVSAIAGQAKQSRL